jgi:hypothetical protein
MLLKNTNDCNLIVETQSTRNPSDLTKITFRREILDSTTKKIISYNNFDMHLTDDEIQRLKQAL